MENFDRMLLDMIDNPSGKNRADVRTAESNALRAGGPRTADGIAASSRNSLRHGLTARQAVLPGEDQSAFDALLQGLTDDRKPEGELEIQLTGEIAACMWRLARARQHEAEILEAAVDLYAGSAAQLELVMRYVGSIERQLNRTIVRLEYVQSHRRKAVPTQFVSQVAENSQPTTHNTQLVMAAGASQPEFVSQVAENPPLGCAKTLAPHGSPLAPASQREMPHTRHLTTCWGSQNPRSYTSGS